MKPEDPGFRIYVHISSYTTTIERVGQLRSLAAEHHDLCNVLAACSAFLLAVGLDQGVTASLVGAGNSWSIGRNPGNDPNPFDQLLCQSLRTRVMQAPELLSQGRYSLKRPSREVAALHELITLRNNLAHIPEEPLVAQTPHPQVEYDGEGVRVRFAPPPDHWGTVTLDSLDRFERAVRLYVEEVLETKELLPGTLLR